MRESNMSMISLLEKRSFLLFRRVLCLCLVVLRVNALVYVHHERIEPLTTIVRRAVSEQDALRSVVGDEERFELTIAERGRTTAEQGIAYGLALSTKSRSEAMPFTSFADYVLDTHGRPVLLLKSDAEHSKNIRASPYASVLLQARGMSKNSQYAAEGCPRITLSGELNILSDDDEDASLLSANFILEHGYAESLLASKNDFRLWRLEPKSIFYVGGFGVKAEWIQASEYTEAKADVVASGAEALVNELNDEKHVADLQAATKHILSVDDAIKTAIVHLDKLGVDFRVERSGDTVEEYRVKYRMTATSVEDAKSELNKLLQEAWEAENGLTFDGNYDSKPAIRKYAQSSSSII